MRLALLSDIHANLRAFQACLDHARAQGADRIALLGDLVGYGPEPGEVVDMAMALRQQGAIVLQGNHDLLAVHGPRPDAPPSGADVGAAWTHARLTPAQRDFLAQLPLQAQAGDALLVHATADDPPAWRYATTAPLARRSLDAAQAAGARCVFGGHVHEQRLWFLGRRGALMPFEPTPGAPIPLAGHRRWLATIGSVGQPRDRDPRAGYALWEDAPQPRLAFFRVAYDHAGAAEAVRRSGLPPELAQRLMEGR